MKFNNNIEIPYVKYKKTYVIFNYKNKNVSL